MSQLEHHERAIRRFRARLMGVLALRYALGLAAVWAFVWGAAVLVLRAAAGVDHGVLIWGAVGFIAAAAAGLALARRRLPAPDRVRAMLDSRASAGGLLMASGEADLGGWRDRLPASAAMPAVRWRGGRAWATLAAAAVFLAVAFLTPAGYLTGEASARPLDVTGQAAGLTEQIDILEEEQVIEEDHAAELREKLDQTAAEADAEDPVKTWESLDHLAQALEQAAEEAADEAVSQTQKLSEAQALAEGLAEDLSRDEPMLGGDALAEAMAHLADMLEGLAAENGALGDALASDGIDPEALRRMAEELAERMAEMSPEELAELRERMREAAGMCDGAGGACDASKASLAEMVERLVEARMVDARMLAACQAAGECDGSGLAAFLAQNPGAPGASMSEMLAIWSMNPNPGISKDGAGAPMTWQPPSEREGAKFEEVVLPPSSLDALRDSAMVGLSAAAPEVVEGPATTEADALRGAADGGGSAHTQRILPRHRRAVERYFDRE